MSRAVLALAVAACLAACQRAPLPAPGGSSGGVSIGAGGSGGSDLGPPTASGGDDLAMSQPPPDPCGTLECTLGASCAIADGCCGCGIVNSGCIQLGWVCAHPASNDPRCPAAPPVLGTACALPASVQCSYCGSGNLPDVLVCGGLPGSPACPDSGDATCWTRFTLFGKCS